MKFTNTSKGSGDTLSGLLPHLSKLDLEERRKERERDACIGFRKIISTFMQRTKSLFISPAMSYL